MIKYMDNYFSNFDREIFMARKLSAYGEPVFMGATDTAVRRERMRAIIINNKLEHSPAGKNTRDEWLTYSELFEKVCGELLIPQGSDA